MGRVPAPAKMTSSMPEPRIEVGRFSPITQRSASSRFDLPQPLGPTIPVMPGSIMSSVGSTKDLKPESRSLSNWTIYTTPFVGLLGELGERRVEFVDRACALVHLAVDEQRRRRVDAEHLAALGLGDHAGRDRVVLE